MRWAETTLHTQFETVGGDGAVPSVDRRVRVELPVGCTRRDLNPVAGVIGCAPCGEGAGAVGNPKPGGGGAPDFNVGENSSSGDGERGVCDAGDRTNSSSTPGDSKHGGVHADGGEVCASNADAGDCCSSGSDDRNNDGAEAGDGNWVVSSSGDGENSSAIAGECCVLLGLWC